MSVFKDIIIDQGRDLDEIVSVADSIEVLLSDLKLKCDIYRKKWISSENEKSYVFLEDENSFIEHQVS